MISYMVMPFTRYLDFKGRSRRKEYWAFFLLNMIVLGVIMALRFGSGSFRAEIQGMPPGDRLAMYRLMFSGVGILFPIWWLIVFIPWVSVTVRRFHDRDMSGWWYLGFVVAGFVPMVGAIFTIIMLVLMCLEGTRGTNRFGPDPKNPASADVFN